MGIVRNRKRSKKLKRGDRVVVPFPILGLLFCTHDLPGHCENSNPDHYGPEGGLLTQKGGALDIPDSMADMMEGSHSM